jgi:AraC family transcriptional regulator
MLRMPEREMNGTGLLDTMGVTELAEVQGIQMLHGASIGQVIQAMRDRVGEPLTLDDMADMACLSPYYFCRVFHQIIGISPGEFLALLRLDAAKRLLLTTSLSVTDICFEVGYSGLGSFTTRFTQLVGVSPGQLRRLVAQPISKVAPSEPRERQEVLAAKSDGLLRSPSGQRANAERVDGGRGVRGRIHMTHPFTGLIFIGLFPKPIPQARPVRCTHLFTPGEFHIDMVPDGRYYLMVAAMPLCEDACKLLLLNDDMRVGAQGPLVVRNGRLGEMVDVVLRPPRVTDPPVISALPYL